MKRDQLRRFWKLIRAYTEAGAAGARRETERELWRAYGERRAVFVLDMSGFSLLSQKFGVVHYLSMVHAMQKTARPILRRRGGLVIKFEADNCFAVFEQPAPALRAGIEINAAFEAANRHTPAEFDIRVSIGIDYGRLLIIGGADLYGNVVNRACKLGEDLAGPGEILVTKEAWRRIPARDRVTAKAVPLAIAGLALPARSVNCRDLA